MAHRFGFLGRFAPGLASLLLSGAVLAAPVAAAHSPAVGASSLASPPSLSEALTGAAKADYDAARILYDDGDFRGAFQKLKSSYEQSKDARLLWNMAACEKN